MANAFKCDVCGEYADNTPLIITLIPPELAQRTLQYELCSFCADDIIKALTQFNGKRK